MQGVTGFVINSLVSLSSGDIIWRVIHFAREIIYYRDRYDGVLQVAELAFSGSSWSLNILSLQALFCISTSKNYADLCKIMGQSIGFGILYCIFKNQYGNSRLASINWLRNSEKLDCASSMASGFFHGYLDIILPKKGDGNKNISERIEDYEDAQSIKIPVKKLILLLPTDFYCPPLLSDFSDDLDTIGNLEFTLRDVAGITKRQYSNTVYKILSKKYYVVAEFATPLLTFYKRYRDDVKMKKYFPEVYEKFYRVLEELLNSSPDCRGTYILVRYSDKTPSGTKTDVAQLISDVVEKELTL